MGSISYREYGTEASGRSLAAALPHGVKLNQLRYALSAAETGSFRRTAAALNLEQSTISRRIRDLEDRLGVKIFERGPSGVRPTPIGVQVLARARTAAAHLIEAKTMAGRSAAAERQLLRIGLFQGLGAGPLEGWIEALVASGLQIALAEGASGDLTLGLATQRVDIAFLPAPPADFSVRAVWREPLAAAMSPAHRLAGASALGLAELAAVEVTLADDAFGELIAVRCGLGGGGAAPIDRRHRATVHSLMTLAALGQTVFVTGASIVGRPREGLVTRAVADAAVDFHAVWSARNDKPALRRALAAIDRLAPPSFPVASSQTPDRWP